MLYTALRLLLVMISLTGLLYPAVGYLIAQLLFPWHANGSMIEHQGKKVGSALIGQSFTNPRYFWGRPSATVPFPYNAEHSSGSNWGLAHPDFLPTLKYRAAYLSLYSQNPAPPPIDLVTASGSGLDPDISLQDALYQVPRIATWRKISSGKIEALIFTLRQAPLFTVLGEPRVNVLILNLALDDIR